MRNLYGAKPQGDSVQKTTAAKDLKDLIQDFSSVKYFNLDHLNMEAKELL